MEHVGNSAERYYKYSFLLITLCAVLTAACCLLPLLMIDDREAGFVLIPCALCLFPFAVYYLVQYLYYRKVEFESVSEVRLEKTDTNSMRMIGFAVKVEVGGIKTDVVTKHVFSAAKKGPNRLDDYSCTDALVGYNRDRDEYIVI